MKKHEIKIAYIGGGSRGWAHIVMADLALCPQLTGELALYDIDQPAARINAGIAARIFSHPDAVTSFRTTVAKSARAALRSADFVVMSIEPGPTEMRYADLEIPRKYGIIQPVGDSTGPGGLLRALRAIPVYADYARLITATCPKAWVINYTNPMTLCTAALHAAAPGIRAFGCCHEVFGVQNVVAGLVAKWFKVPTPDRREIRFDVAGVNHFTLASAASWQEHDLFPLIRAMLEKPGFFRDRTRKARERERREQWFGCDGLIAFDFFRRFGVLGAAGDRHLAEFVPWYLGSEKEILRWSVVLTPYRWRLQRSQKPPEWTLGEKLANSGEEGVAQILALLGEQPLDSNVNLPNHGQMAGIPSGAVVETYAQFRRDSVKPVVAGTLPPPAHELVRRITVLQAMILEAGLTGNRELAFQALLLDPLVRLPPDRAGKMFGEMLNYCFPPGKG